MKGDILYYNINKVNNIRKIFSYFPQMLIVLNVLSVFFNFALNMFYKFLQETKLSQATHFATKNE